MDKSELGAILETAAKIAKTHGVRSVDEIDPARESSARTALGQLGIDEFREADDNGDPMLSANECLAVVSTLGQSLIPTDYLGMSILGRELQRLTTSAAPSDGQLVVPVLSPDLTTLAELNAPAGGVIWGPIDPDRLTGMAVDHDQLLTVKLRVQPGSGHSTDATRPLHRVTYGEVLSTSKLAATDGTRWYALARILVAADLLAAARQILEEAVEYASVRVQYQRPIGSFQALQHLLADAHVDVESATSMLDLGARLVDGPDLDEAERYSRLAKAYTSAASRRIVYAAMQVFGGIAMTWEHAAHLYLRRVTVGRAALGDEDHHYATLSDRSSR